MGNFIALLCMLVGIILIVYGAFNGIYFFAGIFSSGLLVGFLMILFDKKRSVE